MSKNPYEAAKAAAKFNNVSQNEILQGYQLIGILKENNPIHSHKLIQALRATDMYMSSFMFNDLIRVIRENMVTGFQNPTGTYFLINDKEGYQVTNNTRKLNAFELVLTSKIESLKKQRTELRLAISNKR